MPPAQPPGSLNIEYLLVRFEEWAQSLNAPGWPHGFVVFVEDIIILGMVLSLFLVILLVYTLTRLHQVEHEGFHELEMKEHSEHPVQEEEQESSRWDEIMTLASGTNEGEWRRAILEADIMLFDVLRQIGYPGETVGDQLKNANPIQMTTLDLAWKAHKVRNDVAHQGEALHLSERDVQATINYYRRVFEELGAV